MKTSLSVVVVLAAIAVTCLDARSLNKWRVPCWGTTVGRILACGYGGGVGDRSSSRRAMPELPLSSALSATRVTQRDNAIGCYVDGQISAAGLIYDFSGGHCQGNFKVAADHVTVPSKCSGYFLVTLCHPMI